MSVKIRSDGPGNLHSNGEGKDSFGLPVPNTTVTDKEKEHSPIPVSPRGKGYGVRVPVLNDLTGRFSGQRANCRFDIVDKVTTLIKPGSFGPDNEDIIMTAKSPRRDSDEGRRIHFSRQPTIHSTFTSQSTNKASDQRDMSVVDRIGPYHWNKWIRPAKEGDARDVLYRNTYCLEPEFLRYRSLTLPRISPTGSPDRPWSYTSDESQKPPVAKQENGEYSKVVTIVPQQPRGTVVKFREYMRPCTIASEGNSLEVRRFNSKINTNNHFTATRNVFPLIQHDFRRSPKRQERPLKFESFRYPKGNKGTLFTKHILPAYKTAFDRDYSSADTFKEYLETLQTTAKANTPGMHSKEMTGYRNLETRHGMDYHNRALQSVKDVNQPSPANQMSQGESSGNQVDNPIKVEIKPHVKDIELSDHQGTTTEVAQKAHTIENLSSVRGSVVQGRSDSQSNLPMSSSIVGGKSIAKPPSMLSAAEATAAHASDKKPHSAGESEKAHSVVSVVLPNANEKSPDDDVPCPTNTPTPDENPQ